MVPPPFVLKMNGPLFPLVVRSPFASTDVGIETVGSSSGCCCSFLHPLRIPMKNDIAVRASMALFPENVSVMDAFMLVALICRFCMLISVIFQIVNTK